MVTLVPLFNLILRFILEDIEVQETVAIRVYSANAENILRQRIHKTSSPWPVSIGTSGSGALQARGAVRIAPPRRARNEPRSLGTN